MWEVKFSGQGSGGRTQQVAKMQHNGTLSDSLKMAAKVMDKQPKAVLDSIISVRLQAIGVSTGEPKFKKI